MIIGKNILQKTIKPQKNIPSNMKIFIFILCYVFYGIHLRI